MKKYIISFLVLLFINKINSQSFQEKMEKIELNFNDLNKFKSNSDKEELVNEFVPFYNHSKLRNFLIEEKVMAGALCTEFYQSRRMNILKEIYIVYFDKDEEAYYNLVDKFQNVIYDLKLNNCSGMKGGFTQQVINEEKINALEDSYRKWFKILKSEGETYAKNNKLSPTSYTDYKWIEEIGFININNQNPDILGLAEKLMSNSHYIDYFVEANDLFRFYPGMDNKSIISQIVVLSYLNWFQPFTHKVLNFSIVFNSKETDSFKLLDSLCKLKHDESIIRLHDMIKNNEISINFSF